MELKLVKCLVISFLLSLGSIGYAGTEVSISGNVIDESGVAVPNVSIQLFDLKGKLIKETQTTLTGDYVFFPVTFGRYQVLVQAKQFDDYKAEIQVGSAGAPGTEIKLHSAQTKEMVLKVQAKKRLIQASSSSSQTHLKSEQISQLSQGMEVSLPKLMATTTPGVVQGPFGQTFIRGNHANIQYQIDGVQLPDSPSNTFGQALSPRIIDQMELITGGIPAEYGQRLSAVVNIVTKSGPEEPGGEIELNYGSYNTFTPHLLFGGSNQSGSVHYFLSANYNRTDRGLDTPQPESYENQMQGGGESTHNRATGNSEFAKIDWFVDNTNKLSFILFNSQNNFQIPTFPSNFKYTDAYFQPGYEDQFGNSRGNAEPTYNFLPSDTDISQSETNAYAQVIWKHTFTDRSFLQVAPYFKHSSIFVNPDATKALFSYGRINGATPTALGQDRNIDHFGLKTDYSIRPSEDHLIKAGFQVQSSRSTGPVSIQLNPNEPALTDNSTNNGYFEGIYVQDDYTLAKPLILNAGLRFDAAQFSFGGAHTSDYLLQPRLGLNYLLSEKMKLHVFYGKLFQPATVEHLRYQHDPSLGRLTSLQHVDLKAEKDNYYEVGAAYQFMDEQVASLNIYYKEGVNVLDDAQLLNTSIAQPYNFAKGYAYGAELSVRGKITKDWSEFFNYSYGIAKGKGVSGGISDEVSETYQFMDHVQIHTANAGITYFKNNFWWTGQGLYGSGLRTGPDNSLNLPGHFSMDTTVGYQFHGDTWLSRFRLSADATNILNNRYPITIANGYNGSHYAAGRQFFIRIAKDL